MKLHLPRTLPLTLGLASLLGACQAQAPQPAPPTGPTSGKVPFQVLHLGSNCGADSPTVDRIVDAGGLKQAIAGRTVGGNANVPVAADFDRSLVLRLSMGQQPNPGHRLGVSGARIEERAPQRLILDTVWATPEPGRMYAAMVTQPCVIVSVPRGDYRDVAVLDAKGTERMGAPLAPR